jgi:hypothetical protein
MGSNMKLVQFSGSGSDGSMSNPILATLLQIPEFAAMLDAKSEALSGLNLEELVQRVGTFMKTGSWVSDNPSATAEEASSAHAEEPNAPAEEPASTLTVFTDESATTEQEPSAPAEESTASPAVTDEKKKTSRAPRK